MIQRIQTVYLGVSMLLSFLLYYFPFYRVGLDGALIVSASEHLYLLPTAALVIVMHVAVIFMFNNRKRQAQFALWLMILLLIYLACGVAAVSQEVQNGIQISGFRLGAVIPVISLILVWLARYNILKDDALVKSMDRLR